MVAVSGKGDAMTVELDRYVAIGKLLTSAVSDRLRNAPKAVNVDWRAMVNKKFGPMPKGDADEERARTEKAKALETLASSRIGVLIGPAGTGKTTVVQLLLSRTDIVAMAGVCWRPPARPASGLGRRPVSKAAYRLSRSSFSAHASMLIPGATTPTPGRRRLKR